MKRISFEEDDLGIHDAAVCALLSSDRQETELCQGQFAYCVKGGGRLQYRKGDGRKWVLIANWCLYGAYLIVRYKKAVWLRPMYERLFAAMNFTVVAFGPYSIELMATDGSFLHCKRRRFSPPGVLRAVLEERFGLDERSIGKLAGKMVT